MDKHSFNINISRTQDRKSVTCSPELNNTETEETNCIKVATPLEFSGGLPNIWSPEHLFTAAVSSCLMTNFLAIASFYNLEFISFKCDSKGILEKIDGKFVMSEILLFPEVIITDKSKRKRTASVIEKSKKACLISNSITSKIKIEMKIKVEN